MQKSPNIWNMDIRKHSDMGLIMQNNLILAQSVIFGNVACVKVKLYRSLGQTFRSPCQVSIRLITASG